MFGFILRWCGGGGGCLCCVGGIWYEERGLPSRRVWFYNVVVVFVFVEVVVVVLVVVAALEGSRDGGSIALMLVLVRVVVAVVLLYLMLRSLLRLLLFKYVAARELCVDRLLLIVRPTTLPPSMNTASMNHQFSEP